MTLLEKYREEREAGREEGRQEGELCKTVSIIHRMLQKNRSIEEISELIGEENSFVQRVRDLLSVQGTEYDPVKVMKQLLSSADSQE